MSYSINTSDVSQHNLGRLGNHFFRNMVATILAEKYNLKAHYHNHDIFKDMNINFYEKGTEIYTEDKVLDDKNFMETLNNANLTNLPYHILLPEYYQSKEFVFFMKPYFDTHFRPYYEENNKFQIAKNNNHLYIHVRLDDVIHFNPGLSYYEKAIDLVKNNTGFDTGYISSDSPNHPIVQQLINKYNLQFINPTKITDLIMFASICRNIILSHGTFSWLIGFLSSNSNVYYPKVKHIWHGDIFVFPEWNEIDYQ